VIQIFESNPPGELNEICKEIIVLLSETLIKSIKEEGDASSDSAESLVFFRKMKGDYYRYMAEYQPTTTEG
jgi:14-3-3 protein epsilon